MPRKPAGTAVDRRNGARLVSVGARAVEEFPPPDSVTTDEARAAWEAFWTDRQSHLLTESGKVVLLRWVDALDRYLRTLAEADRRPVVLGSTSQRVVNPLYKIAEQARATVEACEKQLGIGGMNAASLGLAAVSEAKSLADLNAKYSQPEDGGEHDDTDGADPRRIAASA